MFYQGGLLSGKIKMRKDGRYFQRRGENNFCYLALQPVDIVRTEVMRQTHVITPASQVPGTGGNYPE